MGIYKLRSFNQDCVQDMNSSFDKFEDLPDELPPIERQSANSSVELFIHVCNFTNEISNIFSTDECDNLMKLRTCENNLRYPSSYVLLYFDYCKEHNIDFMLISCLNVHGGIHFDFLQTTNITNYLSTCMENIFVYDYETMKKTRHNQPYYKEIVCKNDFI